MHGASRPFSTPIADRMTCAMAHHRAGRLAEAEMAYDDVLEHAPRHAKALRLLGVLLHQTGRDAAAAETLERAVTCDPADAGSFNNLGETYRRLRDLPRAERAARQAIALEPSLDVAHNTLGIILTEQGQLTPAVEAFERALALRPTFAEAMNNLGNALRLLGRFHDATAALRRAIAQRADYAEAWCNLGVALKQGGQVDPAIDAYAAALRLNPNYPTAHNNLGLALIAKGQFEAAVAAHERAIALAPMMGDAHVNLGLALQEVGRHAESRAAFARAMEINPADTIAHYNSGLALLLAGDYPAGWREYEWRWKCKEFPSPRQSFSVPQWDGSSPAGKTVLIHEEQGFGDTLQFIRYAPLLANLGAKVIVLCKPAVAELVSRVEGVSAVVSREDALPPFDCHVPMLSLPGLLGTTIETIPANVPYLSASPAAIDAARKYFGAEPGLRIGIAWAGNPGHRRDRLRSIAPSAFSPLARVPGVRWFSLQKGADAATLSTAPQEMKLTDLGVAMETFADTAALIAHFNLVISVDTSLVHLAGAMAATVWTLLPFSPDFRWGLEGDCTPWYPTMRLFRQPRAGDWERVMDRVARELETWSESKGS